jgi:hypothetical protein
MHQALRRALSVGSVMVGGLGMILVLMAPNPLVYTVGGVFFVGGVASLAWLARWNNIL